jgi:hypothetical protein
MKMIICTVMALLVLGCSPSNEKKAKKLIGEKLKVTLHDYSSYEPVKFGTLDTVYSTEMDDSIYFQSKVKYDVFTKLTNEALEEIEEYRGMYSSYYRTKYSQALEKGLRYIDSLKIYEPIVDSIKKAYIPYHKGWSMTHSFRSNNAMGNKTIGHYLYTFDLDITKISESMDISESANEE